MLPKKATHWAAYYFTNHGILYPNAPCFSRLAYTEHEGLSPDVWRSSPSALCQTTNYDGNSRNAAFLSLPQRSATRGFGLPWASWTLRKANERDEAGDEDDEESIFKYNSSSSDKDSEEQSLGNDKDEALTMMLVTFHFWTARLTSFPVRKNYSL